MKYDVMVVGPKNKRHRFRVPYEGVLSIHASIMAYDDILGPNLSHLQPKVVSVTPQLALPYYPA